MPAATTTTTTTAAPPPTKKDPVQQTTEEIPKSGEQIDLDEAEAAIVEKDYKTARPLLEKLGNISIHF
jgi:hypothetical protein